MKTMKSLLVLVLVAVLFCGFAVEAEARWFSDGDHVVVVEETAVLDQSRTVTTLPVGTNFRVSDVNGSYVAVSQDIAGNTVRGWVRQADVMKLNTNTTALVAMRDNLTSGQGQQLGIPKDTPLSIQIDSDYAVDIFVVNEENAKAYWAALKNGGSGEVNVLANKMNVQQGSLTWEPSTDSQYLLIIDNTSFPTAGAKSGRTIHYSLAYCIDDPAPTALQAGKGIIIGRATMDYDNYDGKNGREQKPFKVVIDVVDNDNSENVKDENAKDGKDNSENVKDENAKDGKVLKTLEAQVDQDGYFFLENLSMEYGYRIKKFDGSNFGAPIPMDVEFGFGFLDEEKDEEKKEEIFRKKVSIGGVSVSSPCVETSVLDVGHIALRVNDKGKIQARVDAAHASLASESGSISVGFGDDSGPLDRHDWFLKKFFDSEWSKVIKSDRDGVYKQRQEAAEKKKVEEEEKKKAEQLKAEEEKKKAEQQDKKAADEKKKTEQPKVEEEKKTE